MHPVCFHIGSFPVHWFGVMMGLGFLGGLANWAWLGRREGRDFNYCADLLFWIMLSGIVGARAAYVAADLRYFLARPGLVVRIDQGGLIFYGGLIGATGAIYGFARHRKQRFRAVLDFVVTSVPLAHALGRAGCFLNGCCYGIRHDGSLAVAFPSGSLAWYAQVRAGEIVHGAARALSVHPVQLYEAALNILLYALVVLVYRRRRADGQVVGVYLLAYPVVRFVLEFLRGDGRLRWLGLNIAQEISVALFALGLVFLLTRTARAHSVADG